MKRLFIFDIDGVLCSSKRLHEIAIIKSLNKHGYAITEELHKKELDGLPTRTKLKKLGIPDMEHESIFTLKQEYTFDDAKSYIMYSKDIEELFIRIKNSGTDIAVCSNAIKSFSSLVLEIMKLDKYVSALLTNEDVSNPKPSPEIYIKCMESLNYSPSETVIFEDSRFGLSAAFGSNATVCYIKNPNYLVSKVGEHI